MTLPPTGVDTLVYTARCYVNSKCRYDECLSLRAMLINLENFFHGFQPGIKRWEQRDLRRINSEWMERLKLAIMNIEDVLDDFEAEEIRNKLKSKNKVSKFALCFAKTIKSMMFRDGNLKKLEKSVCELVLVCFGPSGQYFLSKTELNKNDISAYRMKTTGLSFEKVKVFGREKEIELILETILPNETTDIQSQINSKGKELAETGVSNFSLGVLPIVGIKGVGKTQLARTIYNHQRVKQHFELRTWLSISDNFDAARLIQNTLRGFKHDGCFDFEFIKYQYELADVIRNKKFLLVLDDLCGGIETISAWKSLRTVLAEGAPGSVVLVTTQWQSVANNIGTFPSITLDSLLWDDFWELFKYHTFDQCKLNNALPPSRYEQFLLESVGKKISENLNRTPLEAVEIGRSLSRKLAIKCWADLSRLEIYVREHSNLWFLKVDSKNVISLGAAYESLDPEVKQLLLFCALFPKGYVFEKDRLVQMWTSHGIVRPRTGMFEMWETEPKVTWEQRINMLLDRFFLRPVMDNKYVIHGLIRDLANAIPSDEFRILHDYSCPDHLFALHLALSSNDFERCCPRMYERCCPIMYERLRTLMFFGPCTKPIDNGLANIFTKSSSLRLLNLSAMRIGTKGLLIVFEQLPHLRYLDLSFTEINSLAKSICHLCHLEVLDLRGCKFKKLPKRFNNLVSLQHLYASSETFTLIAAIGKLTNLQELKEFSVKPRKSYKIDQLKNMKNIRGRLCISNLEYVQNEKEACESKLVQKEHLDCLALNWDPKCEPKESYKKIAERLQPPLKIQELEILNYPWTLLPSWMERYHYKLKRLEIVGGSLECLPALGHMRRLTTLILKNLKSVKKIEPTFYGSSETIFLSLEALYLIGMEELEEWEGIEGRRIMFPSLEKLMIRSCPVLKSLPNNLPESLEEVHIINCSEELSTRCARGGEDWNKISHVPSINIMHDTDMHG